MWIAAYQFMRLIKWLLRIGFIGHSLYYMYDRAPHLDPFGHLTVNTELVMFGLPLAAVIAGLLQLMFHDRASTEFSS